LGKFFEKFDVFFSNLIHICTGYSFGTG